MIANTPYKKILSVFVIFCFALVLVPFMAFSQDTVGDIVGFVYKETGQARAGKNVTPLRPIEDAVVTLKGVQSGNMYQSYPTDETGAYRIKGVKADTYIVGIKAGNKNFNVNEYVKILAGKTVTQSFTLGSDDDPAAAAPRTRRQAVGFFKKPAGIATVVVGAAAVGFGIYKLIQKEDDKAVSPTER